MITVNALNETSGVRHAFFTRAGGVSEGIYAGLNCGIGSGDDPAKVRENRARAMAMIEMPGTPLVTLYQVHSPRCVVVEAPFAQGTVPEADAMVTRVPGLALGILTADCAPVLFADGTAGVIGAAHAGWKGAIGGVLEATMDAMAGLGATPRDTVAVVGPCIGQRSYEVGPEFRERFHAESPLNDDFFAPSGRDGHHLFDLAGYVSRRLGAMDLKEVARTPCDTCREESRFFSYRRSVLRGEKDYGRGLSAIVLEP